MCSPSALLLPFTEITLKIIALYRVHWLPIVMISHMLLIANVPYASPTITIRSGKIERLIMTTIYPASHDEYVFETSTAMPYGRVDPIDSLMAVVPMYFNEYCICLAVIPPLTLTSLSGAQPTVVSVHPELVRSCLVGRLSMANVV